MKSDINKIAGAVMLATAVNAAIANPTESVMKMTQEQVEAICENHNPLNLKTVDDKDICEISTDGGETWILIGGAALAALALAGTVFIMRRRKKKSKENDIPLMDEYDITNSAGRIGRYNGPKTADFDLRKEWTFANHDHPKSAHVDKVPKKAYWKRPDFVLVWDVTQVETPQEVARNRGGTIHTIGNTIPEWENEIKNVSGTSSTALTPAIMDWLATEKSISLKKLVNKLDVSKEVGEKILADLEESGMIGPKKWNGQHNVI